VIPQLDFLAGGGFGSVHSAGAAGMLMDAASRFVAGIHLAVRARPDMQTQE